MKALRTTLLAALLAGSTGCRNPFDPAADIKLYRFTGNRGLIVEMAQADAASGTSTNDQGLHVTYATLLNYSTVQAQITSYVVVYRQVSAQATLPPGSPIPALGGAAGRRGYFTAHIDGLQDDTTSAGYNSTNVFPAIITEEFIEYVGSNISTIGGGIDCEVIFLGEDHNGHEVKVGGALHVQID